MQQAVPLWQGLQGMSLCLMSPMLFILNLKWVPRMLAANHCRETLPALPLPRRPLWTLVLVRGTEERNVHPMFVNKQV